MKISLIAILAVVLSAFYVLGPVGLPVPEYAMLGVALALLGACVTIFMLARAHERQHRALVAEHAARVAAEAQSHDAVAAERAQWLAERSALTAAVETERAKGAEALRQQRLAASRAGHDDVIAFMGQLQQKGRFLDFVMDDITRYPDVQIGAAARVVHQGCAAVVREYFDIQPVHDGGEGQPMTLASDYDAQRYRLLGRVTGEAPYTGRVLHRGWLTTAVKLPERVVSARRDVVDAGHSAVIVPAEVEIS